MDNYGESLIYQSDDGLTNIEVKIENETVWLTRGQLCELYQSSKSNISEHIKHIFEEGELEENSVVRKFRTTVADGKNYTTIYYNLNMIISLSYRVRSKVATNFRRWATENYCLMLEPLATGRHWIKQNPSIENIKRQHCLS